MQFDKHLISLHFNRISFNGVSIPPWPTLNISIKMCVKKLLTKILNAINTVINLASKFPCLEYKRSGFGILPNRLWGFSILNFKILFFFYTQYLLSCSKFCIIDTLIEILQHFTILLSRVISSWGRNFGFASKKLWFTWDNSIQYWINSTLWIY